jgi:basic membrane protein A
MYDALLTIQEEIGKENFEFVYSESMFIVADAAAAIRDYASEGYNLVIAHGSQYGSSLVEIAPDFPNTSFAWGTSVNTFSDKGITNIFAYEARSEEGGYVCGVLAAKLSQTGIIGVIGPIETGDAKLYVDGFKVGVLATKPDAQVNVNWTGSFSDVALASEAAQTHINVGADVLTGTAQMVLAPEVVVANQVYDWTVVLRPMIQLISEGTMGGTTYALTLANGGLKIVVNQEALIGKTIQDIIEGRIDLKL